MFISNLLIVLTAAYLGKLLSQKINQPAILGELIVGMIVGNLGIMTLSETMGNIADFGILLLLFSTGLAVNFKELKQLGKTSIIVATLGVILPFVLGYYTSIYFGYSKIVSLFIGTSLVATSIGISSQVLSELKMIGMRLGTLIIGAAIADDVIGIVMVGTILGIALNGSVNLKKLSITILLTVVFLVVSFSLGIKLFKKLSNSFIFSPQKTEDILLPVLIIGLLFGTIAKNIGLSMITGTFIAGLILGQTTYSKEVFEKVSLIGNSLFIPIFFVTMGMQFNINAFSSMGVFAVVIITVAIIGKIVGCGLGAKVCRFSNQESFTVGVAMIPRAGVELVLVKMGLEYGIISSDVASIILTMVVFTTSITPSFLSILLKKVKLNGKQHKSKNGGVEVQ